MHMKLKERKTHHDLIEGFYDMSEMGITWIHSFLDHMKGPEKLVYVEPVFQPRATRLFI